MPQNIRTPGFVVRLRINPKDCMSLLDCVDAAGMTSVKDSMSFSGIASLVLSSLLQAQRNTGTIPERDGFEYSRMMAPYLNGASTAAKRTMTAALQVGAASGLAPPVPMVQQSAKATDILWSEYSTLNDSFATHTPEQRARYKELEKVFTHDR